MACTAAEEVLPHVVSLTEEGKPLPLLPLTPLIVLHHPHFSVTGDKLQKELSDSPELTSDGVISAIGVFVSAVCS